MSQYTGTSFHGDVIIAPYNEIIKAIGQPTYGLSADEKSQKEWELQTPDGVYFTVYDWKEYHRDVTDGEPVEWHIGHKGLNIKSISAYLASKGLNVESAPLW